MSPPLSLRQSNRVRKALRLLAQRYPTQRELAKAVGVDRATVNTTLSGRVLGGRKLARGVATALGWDVDVLLDSKRPIEPPPSNPAPATAFILKVVAQRAPFSAARASR
jgi:transcriptional regulator with XRE-family HTH domain